MPRSAGKVAYRMRIRAYPIVARAVEEGVSYGVTRLWKYHDSDTMTEAQMREWQDRISDAVLSSLCEVIEFDPEPEP